MFTDGGKSFLALLYNPEANESALQLTRFSTRDGKSEALLTPLPYRFTDIYSDVRLCYNKDRDIYLAILCYKSASGQDKADVYILGNPVTPVHERNVSRLIVLLLIIAILSVAGFWILWREKRRHRTVRPQEAVADSNPVGQGKETVLPSSDKEDSRRSSGIHMLGGFHVFDTGGAEITASFSPVLMQLLSILILYTSEKGGVSNAILKELLWPDKTDDRFNNNKGVNITKLRKLLAPVGDIAIVTDSGLWMIKDEAGLCDYIVARQKLHSVNADEILTAAMWGPLLPEYHFEWLDTFKSEYTDLVLSRLSDMSCDMPASDRIVHIADAMLKFDSLDEDAVRMKCRALISMGKAGSAKTVFGHFSEEYATVMGEPFGVNFSDFLKNKSH